MFDHASEVRVLLKGKRRASLDRDRVLALALVRLLEIIGEAASRVSDGTRKVNPSVPWQPIISLRNRLIHSYDTVDLDLLWQISRRDIPSLIKDLRRLVN